MRSRGIIFNIQRYSLQDGPGIRTTVFLKGCPLRCLWCHNPEGMAFTPEVATYENRCVACGECVAACPRALPNTAADHGEWCQVCGACVEACPTGARHRVGREITAEELLDELLKDRLFYDDSRGGVTFSGGEPLAQPEFLREMLDRCRRRGIHTAVDTSGLGAPEPLLALAPLVDLFLYDLKAFATETHRKCAGTGNELILDNLRALSRVHDRIWIRLPLVPGFNDAPAMLADTARFLSRLTGIAQVNLLPYHKMGRAKFERLGKPFALADVESPSPAALERVAQLFRAAGLTVKIGG